MANTGKSELTPLEKKEYDDLVARLAAMPVAQRELTMLSAIETAALLKISIGTLDRARSRRRELEQSGEPTPPTSHASIPFARSGDEGPVQYFAQDVVDFLTRLRGAANAPQAPQEPAAATARLAGIRSWMAHAGPADTWPFAIMASGRPLDFMDALSLGALTGTAERLTPREYGEWLGQAAAAEFSSAEREAIAVATSPAPVAVCHPRTDGAL